MSHQPPPPPLPVAAPLLQSPPKTSGMAITSLVFGVISVMGAAILIIPTLLAIILGHVSMGRIRRDPQLSGAGLALAGCILGYISIVFGLFMGGLLAAMAIPAFQKVREASLQKVLINDARQIAAGAQQFMMENGVDEVTFAIDPETGEISGPLAVYLPAVTKGTHQIDGVVEMEGSFSLVHRRARAGQEVVFDSSGHPR